MDVRVCGWIAILVWLVTKKYCYALDEGSSYIFIMSDSLFFFGIVFAEMGGALQLIGIIRLLIDPENMVAKSVRELFYFIIIIKFQSQEK